MKSRIEAIYPLSAIQEGMLYHKLLDENSTGYVVRYVIRMTGELDINKVRQSLDLLSDTYKVLRTSFMMPKKSDRPWQVIIRDRKIELNTIDLTKEDNPSDKLEEIKQKDLHRGFDLEKDSLVRLSVIKTGEQEHIVLWNIHHIILDGWCITKILLGFVNNYAMLNQGMSPEQIKTQQSNGEEASSYEDYIKWLESQDKKKALEYWEELLGDYSNVAEIRPLSKGKVTDEEMEKVSLILSDALTKQITETAKNKSVTVNTILESSLGLLLQKYNRTDDAVFGKVVSGRNADLPGVDEIVGLFVNTIPVRIKQEQDTTAAQLLEQIQNQAINSFCYDYCSLAETQGKTTCGNDLIKVLFAYENYFVDEAGIEKGLKELGQTLKMEIEDTREQTNYPITFCLNMEEQLHVDIMYDPRIYDSEEMNCLLKRYGKIIEQLTGNLEAKVSEFDILLEEEKELILNEFNCSDQEFPKDKTVVELFEEQVLKTPDKTAIVFEKESITYEELNKKVNRLAILLKEKGVGKDDGVLILAEKSIETIIAILGTVKAGGAYIPIDPTYPKDRIDYIIKDSAPKVIIVSRSEVETDVPVIDVWDALTWEGTDENLEPVNLPEDLIYIIYTSGTTGKPKGTMIEHRSVISLVRGTNYISFNENSAVLQGGALGFDASTFEIWGALLNGGCLHLVDSDTLLDARAMKEKIQKDSVNTAFITVSLFNQLISEDSTVFDGMTDLLFGGEKASELHVAELRKANKSVRLTNGYGPTETTTFAVYYPVAEDYSGEKLPIGKPLANKKSYILNNGQLCGIGIPGELCLAGEGVARGYLNRKEMTDEKFIQNPFGEGKMYRTGDLARWLPDGNIDFMGRLDQQVKIRGFRIELSEIEQVMKSMEVISDAAVIVQESNNGKYISAYYVSEENVDFEEVRTYLSRSLPDYMVPLSMMQIDKIPVTRNGKLDRKALPEIAMGSKDSYIAPRNKTEQIVADIFGSILNLDKISVQDNFFEIGGDSIKAIRVVSKLREHEFDITMREVVQSGTVENIAMKLDEGTRSLDINTIPLLEALQYEEFDKTRVAAELERYDQNREQAGVLERYEPFAYQKFFLTEQKESICGAKTEIRGEITEAEIKKVLQEIVKEQTVFRCSYDSVNNELCEFNLVDEWYIPYIDLSEGDNPAEELKQCKALYNIMPMLLQNKLAVKMILVKQEKDNFVIYYYAHHGLWDYLSTETLGNIFKDKCLGINNTAEKDSYRNYTKLRRKKELELQSSTQQFIEEFQTKVDNYKSLTNNRTPKYLVESKGKVSKDVLNHILDNPVQWALQLFTKMNMDVPDDNSHSAYPYILVHFGREDSEHKTLGLFLDSMPQVFDVYSNQVVPSNDSDYSFALFESKYLKKEVRDNYFSTIPAVNFVTVFNKTVASDLGGEYDMKITEIAEKVVIKGAITIRIINDLLEIQIPSFDNNYERIRYVVDSFLKDRKAA